MVPSDLPLISRLGCISTLPVTRYLSAGIQLGSSMFQVLLENHSLSPDVIGVGKYCAAEFLSKAYAFI